MPNPCALILYGHGLTGMTETQNAFRLAGAETEICHVNDLMNAPEMLKKYQILALPGGTSFGDVVGAGHILAACLCPKVGEALLAFIASQKLVIGTGNGAQTLVNMGIVPGLGAAFERHAACVLNANGDYECTWVRVKVNGNNRSPWLIGLDEIWMPSGHQEGQFILAPEALETVRERDMIAGRYCDENGQRAGGKFPINPNGSVDDMAMLTNTTGHVLAVMPHPERAVAFTQRPDWIIQKERYRRAGDKLPVAGDGLKLFKNAVAYFV